MKFNLKVWRQKNASDPGRFETYAAKDIIPDMSFLEMLDVVNDRLVADVPHHQPGRLPHRARRRGQTPRQPRSPHVRPLLQSRQNRFSRPSKSVLTSVKLSPSSDILSIIKIIKRIKKVII